jgi:isopentenyl-diphosphate delta-isomerase
MSNVHEQFEKRKQDHIKLALMSENQSSECNPFDSFSLTHEALPDLNFNEINISSTRFGQPTTTPFMVSSMTAGHAEAEIINRHLIAACATKGWAMGVGSQRRELDDKTAALAWQSLRADFPSVSLFSNLGIAQLINTSIADLKNLTLAIQAEALIIHCNPLQECIQPEGTPQFKGCLKILENVAKNLDLPLIIKETGCGFSKKTLQRLQDCGIAAIDVSGLGGTHWGRIEGHRATANQQKQAALTFKNWGIDTLQSVMNATALKPNFEIWGSGGVRNGLDAAKLCALGTSTIGIARPLLEAALLSAEQVIHCMDTFEYELKVAMFCTGSQTLADLKESL